MITKRDDLITINSIRQYAESNYHKDITIGSLCQQFNINRTKLQEGFNQLFGIPIHAFLFQLRMDKARSLLRATNESIKVIAAECGYKSVSSFTRAFSKLNMVSPAQYRKQFLS